MGFFRNGPFTYQRTNVPDGSGMEIMAFGMPTTLPLIMWQGSGTPYGYKWNPLQSPQVYQQQQQRLDGQIGIVAGQVAMQPLIDNRDFTG